MHNIVLVWALLSVGIFAIGCWGLRVAWELVKTGAVICFAIVVLALVGCTSEEVPVETVGLVVEKEYGPTKCRHLVRTRQQLEQDGWDSRNEAWAECMGVGYK